MRQNPLRTAIDYVRRERLFRWQRKLVKDRKKNKIFVLGQNKTGTTSLESYLKSADFIAGDQRRFDLETEKVLQGKFRYAKKLIDAAECFQDVPFSYASIPFLDFLTSAYPDAFFILNTRNREEWYQSCDRFYRKIWIHHDNEISWEDLDGVRYHGGGIVLRSRVKRKKHSSPFQKEPFLESFNAYNDKIQDYFLSRPHLKFLQTDVTCKQFDSNKLSKFLHLSNPPVFPHLNRTR